MLSTNMKEGLEKKIRMEFEPQTVKLFLSYMYKGTVEVDNFKSCALDLLQMGKMYEIDTLYAFCENFIASYVTSDNVSEVCKTAKLMESDKLLDACKACFKRYGSTHTLITSTSSHSTIHALTRIPLFFCFRQKREIAKSAATMKEFCEDFPELYPFVFLTP